MESVFVPVVVASVLSELYLEQQVWYYVTLKFVSRSESILMRGLGVDRSESSTDTIYIYIYNI